MWIARTGCPGCRGTETTTVLSLPYSTPSLAAFLTEYYGGKLPAPAFTGADYELVECRSCSLVYQHYVPDRALSDVVYEPPQELALDVSGAFDRYESNRSLSYFTALVPGLVDVLSFLGGRPRRVKVLDFGMGWGNWCQLAKGFGCDVAGFETSPLRLAWAEQIGVRTVTWDEIAAETFDYINVEQVLEHVDDPRAIVQHLRGALTPRGLIKLSGPDAWRVKELARARAYERGWRAMSVVQPLEHLNAFTGRSLTALAATCGLRPVALPRTTPLPLMERALALARPLYWALTGRTSTSVIFERIDAARPREPGAARD